MVVRTELESFYSGKPVLVTGHTGFKGGWLATWLKRMGSQVAGLALPQEHGTESFYVRAQVGKGMKSIFADVRDLEAVRKSFKRCRPEIVFHLAAQSLVLRSYSDPVGTYAANVMGTVHVLEVARQTPSVKAVVIVTSDKCYENRGWLWGYREQDALGGHDPYSSSKGCAELVTSAYRRSFSDGARQLAIASARAGNVIGGGDWSEDRLIPDLVRGIAGKSTVLIRNPGAYRPWQHVLDPLHGYLLLGRRLYQAEKEFADAWNFGPHDGAHSVEEVATEVVRLWGRGKLEIDRASSRGHEARYLKLDCSKANSMLGWRNLLSLQETLRLTVEWYRTVAANARKGNSITAEQLEYFLGLPC